MTDTKRSYAEAEIFSQKEQDLFGEARYLVGLVPLTYQEDYVRCHELARYVGRKLNLYVQDGKYGRVDHSWLVLPNHRHLLDVYCCGRIPMVQLVDLFAGLPEAEGYRPGPERDDIREDVITWLLQHEAWTAP